MTTLQFKGTKFRKGAVKAKLPPKPETYDMFGIVNAQGSLWSRHTFADRSAAEKYLREHELNKNCDLAKHQIVPVRVTIALSRASDGEPQ